MESSTLKFVRSTTELKGMVVVLLSLFCFFNCFAQTNTISISNPIFSTNWDFQIGFNYSDNNNNKFGACLRAMVPLNPYAKVGLETDFIDGNFYQSSANGQLGKYFDIGFGDIYTYATSGIGYRFKNPNNSSNTSRLIAIAGIGLGYQTPIAFKLFGRYPTRFDCSAEYCTYSDLAKPVYKQFFGIRLLF